MIVHNFPHIYISRKTGSDDAFPSDAKAMQFRFSGGKIE